ncbi:Type IV pilus assembly protein PilM [uncultured Desulfatiglans sp.]|nr:Type IV pilus assembly protein PilM [uncultured Desulfatiglans sp.]
MMLGGARNQLVGVDIGSQAIKVVELAGTRRGRVLRSIGLAVLPDGAVEEGVIRQSSPVVELLRDLFAKLKIRNRNVAASLSGCSAMVKRITVRRSEGLSLEELIDEEAEQYIPFDVHQVNLDFDVLEGSGRAFGAGWIGAAEAELLDVMLVAAKKRIVEDRIQVLEQAGLNPMVLDVDAFAMQNAFEISSGRKNGCYALVNLGAQELCINIVEDGIPIFSSDSPSAGSEITKEVMRHYGVDSREGERIKLGRCLLRDNEKLDGIMQGAVENWTGEIIRALDFAGKAHPGLAIEGVYVCGGSCRVPGFQPFLEKKTGLKVAEIDPFRSLVFDKKRIDPVYLSSVGRQAVVAVGLALREIGDK